MGAVLNYQAHPDQARPTTCLSLAACRSSLTTLSAKAARSLSMLASLQGTQARAKGMGVQTHACTCKDTYTHLHAHAHEHAGVCACCPHQAKCQQYSHAGLRHRGTQGACASSMYACRYLYLALRQNAP